MKKFEVTNLPIPCKPAALPLNNVLTQREHKVIEYAAQGFDNEEIAKELFISRHTVKVHIASALRKLSAINRTQAVYLAKKYNIID